MTIREKLRRLGIESDVYASKHIEAARQAPGMWIDLTLRRSGAIRYRPSYGFDLSLTPADWKLLRGKTT